jgi:hypothetical protein
MEKQRKPAVKDCKGKKVSFRYPLPSDNIYSFKLQSCKFFALGECRKGDQCLFTHSITTMPEVNTAPAVESPAAICEPGRFHRNELYLASQIDPSRTLF